MDGFPALPTVVAIDPVQSLVALGTPGGRIKVYPPFLRGVVRAREIEGGGRRAGGVRV